jgi:hypothetical protein
MIRPPSDRGAGPGIWSAPIRGRLPLPVSTRLARHLTPPSSLARTMVASPQWDSSASVPMDAPAARFSEISFYCSSVNRGGPASRPGLLHYRPRDCCDDSLCERVMRFGDTARLYGIREPAAFASLPEKPDCLGSSLTPVVRPSGVFLLGVHAFSTGLRRPTGPTSSSAARSVRVADIERTPAEKSLSTVALVLLAPGGNAFIVP